MKSKQLTTRDYAQPLAVQTIVLLLILLLAAALRTFQHFLTQHGAITDETTYGGAPSMYLLHVRHPKN